jgi:DHA2 family multidrug resistance protein
MHSGEHKPINPWIIAATVMLATFMEVLDTSVANVSLPHIAGSLDSTNDEATWVLTSYLVANAIVLPLSGFFSELFGRKRFYMACVIIFTVSSTLCGLAPSLGALIVFRVLQGLGGGALQPVSQAILVESFPKEKRGVAMAFYGMGVVVAPIIGPTLGGWITDNYSWRWIFLINIPVGVLSVLLTGMLIHDPHFLKRKAAGFKLDYIGLGLLSLGLAFLEIVLDEGQREDWFGSRLILWSAVIAVFALVSVVVWELRQKEPVVDFHVLRDRNFAISTLTMFMLGFVLYGSSMMLPLFLQTMLGYSATQSGLVLSPGGVVVVCLLPLVGVLVSKTQPRWLVVFGLVFCSLGLLLMGQFTLEVDFHHAVLSRIVQSVGLAFLFVPINATAFNFITREKTGYATGLINLARNVGGSAGIAMCTTIVARRAQFHQNLLVGNLSWLEAPFQNMVQGAQALLFSRGSDPAQAAQQAQGLAYYTLVRQANMMAFIDAFRILAVLFLAMVPLMFFMRKTKPRKGPVAME